MPHKPASFEPDYPGALVIEAGRYGYGRPNQPKGWVLHTPEEPADDHMSTPYYFHTLSDRNASTHYFVSYHGFVVQMAPEREGAYANAVEGKPYPTWANSQVNLNLQTLSVEIEGRAATIAQTMTAAQRRALVDLLRYGCRKYGIPMERSHIIGHYEVSRLRTDPGTLDIDELVLELKGESEMTEEQVKLLINQALAREFAARLRHDAPQFRDHVNHLLRLALAERDQRIFELGKALSAHVENAGAHGAHVHRIEGVAR